EHRHTCATSLHLYLYLLVTKFAGPQLFAKAFARGRACPRPHKGIEHAFFCRLFSARLHVFPSSFANECNADFDKIATDLLDIAPDIANFRKFGRFDLEKWRTCESGKAP